MKEHGEKAAKELKEALRGEFRDEVEARAKESWERIKEHSEAYLNRDGAAELEAIAAEHLKAMADMHTLETKEQRAAQAIIVDNYKHKYDVCFTRNKVKQAFATVDAKKEVMDFVKTTGKEFLKVAGEVALKHSMAALKEGLS